MWRALGTAAAFVSNMDLARFLGADGLGAHTIVFTVGIFASTAGAAGLIQALARFIARYAEKRDAYRLRNISLSPF